MKQKAKVTRIEQAVYWHGRHPFLHVRSTFSSKQPYATHFHDCLSLGVLFQGGTVVRCSGGASTIHAGRMTLIAPMGPHNCNPLEGRARGYHMLYIDRAWVLAALNAPLGSRLTVKKRILDDSALWNALMRLAAAIREGRDDYSGCDALAEAIKTHVGVLPAAGETPSKTLTAWIDGMDAAGERAASVEERARELGMWRESFTRSFRRATGVTPVQYRQCLRLIRARECLRAGRSLVDTALACGYADQSYFHSMCLGIVAGNAAYIALAIAGWMGLSANPTFQRPLEIAGALYLGLLGLRIFHSAQPLAEANESAGVALPATVQFMMGLGSAILNPKNMIFYLSIMTVLIESDALLRQRIAAGVWMCSVVLLWDMFVAAVISHAAVQKTLWRWIPTIERVCGAFLILVAVSVIFSL